MISQKFKNRNEMSGRVQKVNRKKFKSLWSDASESSPAAVRLPCKMTVVEMDSVEAKVGPQTRPLEVSPRGQPSSTTIVPT
jgi:hypothetical protein